VKRAQREHFDHLLEAVIESLPVRLRQLIDEVPIIVEDHPDPKLLEELGMDPDNESLCGLHTGTPRTEKSIEDPFDHPETVHLFREGIVDQAEGWEAGDEAVIEEIRITLLHEIGHHFGLEEDDLERLGYD
jgi:predicted Zn-dependent protease with MMP-like domain